jgi:hypothetical protein
MELLVVKLCVFWVVPHNMTCLQRTVAAAELIRDTASS